MRHFVDNGRVLGLKTFEATLCDISTQRQIDDDGDPRDGFVLDETPDSALILDDLRNQYEHECRQLLDEWANDSEILHVVQERLMKPPIFHLQTSAEFIFAEGDRVSVSVPSPNGIPISELLGDIISLEIIR